MKKKIYSTSCEELIHWKRLWCWEWLGAGGEGDDRGWDSWMASPTRWAGVWVNSGSWWLTGRPGVLQFMGSQRVGHDWSSELNWLIWTHKKLQNRVLNIVIKLLCLYAQNILSAVWGVWRKVLRKTSQEKLYSSSGNNKDGEDYKILKINME